MALVKYAHAQYQALWFVACYCCLLLFSLAAATASATTAATTDNAAGPPPLNKTTEAGIISRFLGQSKVCAPQVTKMQY